MYELRLFSHPRYIHMSEFSDPEAYNNYLAYKAYKKYKRKYKLAQIGAIGWGRKNISDTITVGQVYVKKQETHIYYIEITKIKDGDDEHDAKVTYKHSKVMRDAPGRTVTEGEVSIPVNMVDNSFKGYELQKMKPPRSKS